MLGKVMMLVEVSNKGGQSRVSIARIGCGVVPKKVGAVIGQNLKLLR